MTVSELIDYLEQHCEDNAEVLWADPHFGDELKGWLPPATESFRQTLDGKTVLICFPAVGDEP